MAALAKLSEPAFLSSGKAFENAAAVLLQGFALAHTTFTLEDVFPRISLPSTLSHSTFFGNPSASFDVLTPQAPPACCDSVSTITEWSMVKLRWN